MLLECLNEDQKPLGFLPKGIVAMLVGAGGVGKTHLLFQLAISIATGTPFINKFTPTIWCGEGKKGNVFIGLGENQYEDIHRLLYKSSKKFRNTQPDILKEASNRIAVFSFCGQQAAFIESKRPSRYFQDLKVRLAEAAPPGGWSLIILDPVSRLLGADAEMDNATATQFIALLEELTIEIPGNPTVFFAHHVNKASLSQSTQDQSAARGSSALTDGARWQMNLAQATNEKEASSKDASVTLKMTKSNFTMIFPEIRLQKDGDGCLISQRAGETARNLF
jgi:RecA-family ATPase